MSAVTSLLSPTRCKGYAALVLFDPPLCKPGSTYWEFDEACTIRARMIRNRVSQFQTREEFTDILSLLSPFYRAVPGVFELVSRTTPSPIGGRGLRTPVPRRIRSADCTLCQHFWRVGELWRSPMSGEDHWRRSNIAVFIPADL